MAPCRGERVPIKFRPEQRAMMNVCCTAVFAVIYPLVNIQKTIENQHFSWENPLFLWPFSIAMLNYQRVDVISLISCWCSRAPEFVGGFNSSYLPLG